MKTISGIEFASEHNGTDVFRVIELAYEQGWKDGHSEQLGTNLAEDGTDLISRKQAINALSTITMYKGSIPFDTAVMRIEQLPSVQPGSGKWIDANICGELPVIVCDQCHTFFPIAFGDFHNFCPNCGAKMEVTE